MAEAGDRVLFVAVDHSEGTNIALNHTVQHQYRKGDRVYLVHVVRGTSKSSTEKTVAHTESFTGKSAKEDDFIEERYGSVLKASGIPYEVVILQSDGQSETVADTLVRYAVKVKAVLIIVAKHDKGIKKWLTGGGVVKNIIEESPIPVIVLNTNPVPIGKAGPGHLGAVENIQLVS
eukprot:jgi/Botrbrau1/8379/Bobra.0237s0002.1